MCYSPTIRRDCCRTEEAGMIDLYYTPGSPPCRLVLLVLAALEIPVNRIVVDLMALDQMKPEFLALNPQHTVPTIVDGDFVLWESRAIARYLVNRYNKDGKMYPLDHKDRGLVDQRLDFDLGTLCPAFSQYFYPQLFSGTAPNEAQKKKLETALKHLNTFLDGQEFVAGPNMTIADLCLVTTVSTIDAACMTLAPYPNVVRWFDRVKNTAPGYEQYNEKGLLEFRKLIDNVKVRDGQSQSKCRVKPGGVQNTYQEQCIQPSGYLYHIKAIPEDSLSNKVTVETKYQALTPLLSLIKPPNPKDQINVQNQSEVRSKHSIFDVNSVQNETAASALSIVLPHSRVLTEAHAYLDSDTDNRRIASRKSYKM